VRIAEIFHSIQGEGEFTGTPSVFVRTTGCNLRCWFCDTPYTSWNPEGTRRTWRDVLDEVLRYDCEHVVITGGEPMLQPEIVPLSESLATNHRHVTIETAGTVYRPAAVRLMSISPKLSNSTPRDLRQARWAARHERDRTNRAVMHRLLKEHACQLKFVVNDPADLAEIEEFLQTCPPVASEQVWLMPQGTERSVLAAKAEWLEPEALRRGYRFCPRRHIELYGNVRGK
jgi:7-carboxy-7-deazaguanine synthase